MKEPASWIAKAATRQPQCPPKTELQHTRNKRAPSISSPTARGNFQQSEILEAMEIAQKEEIARIQLEIEAEKSHTHVLESRISHLQERIQQLTQANSGSARLKAKKSRIPIPVKSPSARIASNNRPVFIAKTKIPITRSRQASTNKKQVEPEYVPPVVYYNPLMMPKTEITFTSLPIAGFKRSKTESTSPMQAIKSTEKQTPNQVHRSRNASKKGGKGFKLDTSSSSIWEDYISPPKSLLSNKKTARGTPKQPLSNVWQQFYTAPKPSRGVSAKSSQKNTKFISQAQQQPQFSPKFVAIGKGKYEVVFASSSSSSSGRKERSPEAAENRRLRQQKRRQREKASKALGLNPIRVLDVDAEEFGSQDFFEVYVPSLYATEANTNPESTSESIALSKSAPASEFANYRKGMSLKGKSTASQSKGSSKSKAQDKQIISVDVEEESNLTGVFGFMSSYIAHSPPLSPVKTQKSHHTFDLETFYPTHWFDVPPSYRGYGDPKPVIVPENISGKPKNGKLASNGREKGGQR